ncbi:hypothetical protein [Gillisia limnaea]|nr:hypothetical protein [Gillisia limnaea]
MKKILLLCLIIISSNSLWSQNNYEIDSIVSVSISGEDIKIDSLQNEKIAINFYSMIGNSEFSVQKELFENDSLSIYDSNLPYDLKSLEKYYETLAKNYVKSTNLKLESEKLIENNSFKGFHLRFTGAKKNSIYEVEYFLLNRNIYIFSYKNTVKSDENDSEQFFNSIKINSDKKISQFLGKSAIGKSAYNLGYKVGYTVAKHPSYLWIGGGLILILITGTIVYFVRRK